MLEIELFAFTLFIMGINDSVLDQIGFLTLCRNKLWSKTEVALYLSRARGLYEYLSNFSSNSAMKMFV